MQRLQRRKGEHIKPEQQLKDDTKITYVLVIVIASVVRQLFFFV